MSLTTASNNKYNFNLKYYIPTIENIDGPRVLEGLKFNISMTKEKFNQGVNDLRNGIISEIVKEISSQLYQKILESFNHMQLVESGPFHFELYKTKEEAQQEAKNDNENTSNSYSIYKFAYLYAYVMWGRQ